MKTLTRIVQASLAKTATLQEDSEAYQTDLEGIAQLLAPITRSQTLPARWREDLEVLLLSLKGSSRDLEMALENARDARLRAEQEIQRSYENARSTTRKAMGQARAMEILRKVSDDKQKYRDLDSGKIRQLFQMLVLLWKVSR